MSFTCIAKSVLAIEHTLTLISIKNPSSILKDVEKAQILQVNVLAQIQAIWDSIQS